MSDFDFLLLTLSLAFFLVGTVVAALTIYVQLGRAAYERRWRRSSPRHRAGLPVSE
jgi:hypothetical protein